MTASSDWVDQARRLVDAFVQGQASPTPGSATHAADCAWCPFCQAAAMVRGERPELTVALADVLTATATALRTFAESVQPAEPGSPAAGERTPEAHPSSPVQRIEIS